MTFKPLVFPIFALSVAFVGIATVIFAHNAQREISAHEYDKVMCWYEEAKSMDDTKVLSIIKEFVENDGQIANEEYNIIWRHVDVSRRKRSTSKLLEAVEQMGR